MYLLDTVCVQHTHRKHRLVHHKGTIIAINIRYIDGGKHKNTRNIMHGCYHGFRSLSTLLMLLYTFSNPGYSLLSLVGILCLPSMENNITSLINYLWKDIHTHYLIGRSHLHVMSPVSLLPCLPQTSVSRTSTHSITNVSIQVSTPFVAILAINLAIMNNHLP